MTSSDGGENNKNDGRQGSTIEGEHKVGHILWVALSSAVDHNFRKRRGGKKREQIINIVSKQ